MLRDALLHAATADGPVEARAEALLALTSPLIAADRAGEVLAALAALGPLPDRLARRVRLRTLFLGQPIQATHLDEARALAAAARADGDLQAWVHATLAIDQIEEARERSAALPLLLEVLSALPPTMRSSRAALAERVATGLKNVGRFDEARAWYREAAGLYEAAGQHLQRGWLLTNLGNLETQLGQHDAAEQAFAAAIAIAAARHDHASAAHARGNRAVSRMFAGRPEAALEEFLELADDGGRRGVWMNYCAGLAARLARRPAEARAPLEAAIRLADAMGLARFGRLARLAWAAALADLGAPDAADPLLAEVPAADAETEALRAIGAAHVAWARGQRADAEAALEAAIRYGGPPRDIQAAVEALRARMIIA